MINTENQQRFQLVMAYIIENFKKDISLSDAAAVAKMTAPAFCKYFKKITTKTFIEAVTDYRVVYAVQQLVNTVHSIADIGFDSGFNDLSHFHKTLQMRMLHSPLCYRNIFIQKLSMF